MESCIAHYIFSQTMDSEYKSYFCSTKFIVQLPPSHYVAALNQVTTSYKPKQAMWQNKHLQLFFISGFTTGTLETRWKVGVFQYCQIKVLVKSTNYKSLRNISPIISNYQFKIPGKIFVVAIYFVFRWQCRVPRVCWLLLGQPGVTV